MTQPEADWMINAESSGAGMDYEKMPPPPPPPSHTDIYCLFGFVVHFIAPWLCSNFVSSCGHFASKLCNFQTISINKHGAASLLFSDPSTPLTPSALRFPVKNTFTLSPVSLHQCESVPGKDH